MVMKEVVEDKKIELMWLGTKIPAEDVYFFDLSILSNYMDWSMMVLTSTVTATQCKNLSMTWLVTQMFLLCGQK